MEIMIMSHRKILLYWWLGVFVLSGVFVGGCTTSPSERLRERLAMLGDNRLDNALRRSIVASGGIDNWAHLRQIEGEAIATLVGSDGGNTLMQQQYVIVPGDRVLITVANKEPDGVYTEWLDQKGKIQGIFQGQIDKTTFQGDKFDLYASALRLRLFSQAMTGAVGLLQKDFTLRYAGQERKGGRLTHKIEVTGALLGQGQFKYEQSGNLLVAWIDAETYLFERLQLRYHTENNRFGYLEVNIADYNSTPEGLVLPGYIELVRIDEDQQFSPLNLMTLEFQKLQTISLGK